MLIGDIIVLKIQISKSNFSIPRTTNILIQPYFTPTKGSNAQHLVEYKKKTIAPGNKKSGSVIQQPMHSYVCGINLRSESSIVMSVLLLARIGVPEFERNVFIEQKVNMTN